MLRFGWINLGSIAFSALLLSGCGGGSRPKQQPQPPATTFTIGGTVNGLNAGNSVVLQNNGGNNYSAASNGTFTFTTALASGSSYNVTVLTNPTGQTCTLASASGANLSGNVTNVNVTCTTNQYTLSAEVSGLNGDLILQNNAANNLSISTIGTFAFSSRVAHGEAYSVTVLTKPAEQTCTVTNGSAQSATSNVTVAVACTANSHTIGGTISGLGALPVVLQNNLGDDLSLTGSTTTSFTFQTPLGDNSLYFVSVRVQPGQGQLGQRGQTCTVADGSGAATGSVDTIQVTCTDNPATVTVGGTVSGLSGSVTLRNVRFNGTTNVTEDLPIGSEGPFTFPTPAVSGEIFNVSVVAQPANQRCVVRNNAGLATADVTSVNVVCTDGTADFAVGGQITGLNAPGLVISMDVNGAAPFLPPGTTNFTMPRRLPPGTPYNALIAAQPAGQTCIITDNQEEEMPAADDLAIRIACVDNVFNDTASRLAGTYVVSDTAGLAGGHRFFLTLYPDGVYLMATRQDNPTCGRNNGNGVELGAYNYDSTTGVFSIVSNVLDTNGECGVWDGSGWTGTLEKGGVAGQGRILTLTDPDSNEFTLTPAPSIPNTAVGSFREPFRYDVAILGNDGRYTITVSNSDDDTSNEMGIEYGCYSATNGTFTVDARPATCPGFVDTNDDAGLFEPGETGPKSFQYSIPSPYQFRLDDVVDGGITVFRVVPN